MKAWDIIGYVYDGEIHCPACAEEHFGGPFPDDQVDANGDPVQPIFARDYEGGDHCNDCFEALL